MPEVAPVTSAIRPSSAVALFAAMLLLPLIAGHSTPAREDRHALAQRERSIGEVPDQRAAQRCLVRAAVRHDRVQCAEPVCQAASGGIDPFGDAGIAALPDECPA